ncbi:hypothetical protein N9602_05905 [Saprospiraceae bacterium]|nr:hypothetical protein [Saprospiraceae bacterium]
MILISYLQSMEMSLVRQMNGVVVYYINQSDSEPYKAIERSVYLRMIQHSTDKRIELYNNLDDSIRHKDTFQQVGEEVNGWYLEYIAKYDLLTR